MKTLLFAFTVTYQTIGYIIALCIVILFLFSVFAYADITYPR